VVDDDRLDFLPFINVNVLAVAVLHTQHASVKGVVEVRRRCRSVEIVQELIVSWVLRGVVPEGDADSMDALD